ncbi:MAG: hypothetical protein K2L77_07075 [Muribaculaceae bacterium]|nr:hypothetical protein [Muribaculaceae bacterium]
MPACDTGRSEDDIHSNINGCGVGQEPDAAALFGLIDHVVNFPDDLLKGLIEI